MSEKLSTSDILSKLLERVQRIEGDSHAVAGVLEKMLARLKEQSGQ